MNCIDLDRELYSHNHIKGCWEHHIEWCPKYRYNVLQKQSIREDCEAILYQICAEQEWKPLELAVMPDHVHVVIRTFKPMSPSEITFRLKGRTAHDLFKKHPNLEKRYPRKHLWSRGSFQRTVGTDLETARKYVRNQQDIHQKKLDVWAS